MISPPLQSIHAAIEAEQLRLTGLHLGILDAGETQWIYYDLGKVALNALYALQIAVLAMEQLVTGEKLVHALHVGDFYAELTAALDVENGQGILSEPESVSSLQDEIHGLIDLVLKARKVAKTPR